MRLLTSTAYNLNWVNSSQYPLFTPLSQSTGTTWSLKTGILCSNTLNWGFPSWLGALVFLGLISFSARAQSTGANPAVIAGHLLPSPVEKVGSPCSLTFTLGNNGLASPIGGSREEDRMGFYIELSQCKPSPADEKALSGSALSSFDVKYNPELNRFEGRQKEGVVLEVLTLRQLIISAVVTQATSSTADNSIGATCTILPNASAQPYQLLGDDRALVFTYTLETAKPVGMGGFVALAQADRTNLLEWTTVMEKNTFTVERSKDGKTFERIGEVSDESGNNKNLSFYRFVDKTPLRGTSYYRLQQTAADGSTYTSSIQAILPDIAYGIAPNPVSTASFTLTLDEPDSATLHLYSVKGQEIGLTRSEPGETSLKLTPTVKLEPGAYLLNVEERGQLRQHRLVVL